MLEELYMVFRSAARLAPCPVPGVSVLVPPGTFPALFEEAKNHFVIVEEVEEPRMVVIRRPGDDFNLTIFDGPWP